MAAVVALVMINPGADDPLASRTILQPVGPHEFKTAAVGLNWGAVGERLTFELDAAGRVARIRYSNFNWIPVR